MTIGPWLCDGGTSQLISGTDQNVTNEHSQMTGNSQVITARLSRFCYCSTPPPTPWNSLLAALRDTSGKQ